MCCGDNVEYEIENWDDVQFIKPLCDYCLQWNWDLNDVPTNGNDKQTLTNVTAIVPVSSYSKQRYFDNINYVSPERVLLAKLKSFCIK